MVNTSLTGRPAIDLNGRDIGSIISFEWSFDLSGVRAAVTGRLRQISQAYGETIVQLSDPDDFSHTTLVEFVLSDETHIETVEKLR